MLRLVCSEFEEFEEALAGVSGRYLLTARPERDWRLRAVELDGVTLLCGQDAAGNLYQASCDRDRYALFVPLGCAELLAVNGQQLHRTSAAWLTPGPEFHIRSAASTRWLTVLMSAGAVDDMMEASHDRMLAKASTAGARVGAASPASLARIIEFARCAVRTVSGPMTPGTVPAEAIRTHLLHCVLAVLDSMPSPESTHRGRPRVLRPEVVDHALDAIDQSLDQPLPVGRLCQVTGVSARTLHSIFMEQFGMSPHQYIVSRRLHAIHSVLRHAGREETVSGICSRFGVWDFGRFAQAYRHRFGRAPSETLLRGH